MNTQQLIKNLLLLYLMITGFISYGQNITLSNIQVLAKPAEKGSQDTVTFVVMASASSLQPGDKIVVLAGTAENKDDVGRVSYIVNYEKGVYSLHPGFTKLKGTAISAPFSLSKKQLTRAKYLTIYIDKKGVLISNQLYYKMPFTK